MSTPQFLTDTLNACVNMQGAVQSGAPVNEHDFQLTVINALVALTENAIGTSPTTDSADPGVATASTTDPIELAGSS